MGLSDFFSTGGTDSDSKSFSGIRGDSAEARDRFGMLSNDAVANTRWMQDELKRDLGNNVRLNTDKFGFFVNPYTGQSSVGNAFQEAVNQGFNKASGSAALRGMSSPASLEAVAGSAAQNVLPQFIPLLNNNALMQTTMPHDMRTQRLNQFEQLLNLYPSLLGNEQSQKTRTRSAQPGGSFMTNFMGGLGTGLASGITDGLKGAAGGMNGAPTNFLSGFAGGK